MHDAKDRARVAIIGFDSLDFRLLKHWADRGQLPTFKKLFTTTTMSLMIAAAVLAHSTESKPPKATPARLLNGELPETLADDSDALRGR